jgi:hypothetical protein
MGLHQPRQKHVSVFSMASLAVLALLVSWRDRENLPKDAAIEFAPRIDFAGISVNDPDIPKSCIYQTDACGPGFKLN